MQTRERAGWAAAAAEHAWAAVLFGALGLGAAGFLAWQSLHRPASPGPAALSMADRRPCVFERDLFDLGVVDVDGDGRLDIFTANHFSRQTLVLNEAGGGFRDVLWEWGLAQDRAFPGLEEDKTEPSFDAPGVYLHWLDDRFHVRVHRLDLAPRLAGSIRLSSPVTVETKQGFEVQVVESPASEQVRRSTVGFSLTASATDGLLTFKPRYPAVPVSVELPPQLPLDRVRVGSRGVHPSAHAFTLLRGDRHGMAWADWDGDERLDVFIARGGMHGRMALFPEPFSDELFRGTGTRFEDVTAASGILKKGSRARQAVWVDYDRDGRLDLYVSSVNGPDQLHRQTARGRFSEVARDVGLVNEENAGVLWLDSDQDGDMDLLLSGAHSVSLYVSGNGRFESRRIASDPAPAGDSARRRLRSRRPIAADFDRDGDLDVFVAGPGGASALLVNDEGRFTVRPATDLGLPARALSADWIDVDNDGLMDLHLIPGGLYLQRLDGRFTPTGRLDPAPAARTPLIDALCTWADLDNDGSRDLLMAWLEEQERETVRWSLWFVPSPPSPNRWLQVELIGPPGNRQAIGASVTLREASGRQVASMVGAAEGSHFSQGHYRLYFGLGADGAVESLRVRWPDGRHQDLRAPPLNRVLRIAYEPAD